MKIPKHTISSSTFRTFGLVLAGAILTSLPASAATRTWQGSGGSTDWATGANWAVAIPVSNDSLIFTSANASPSNMLTNTLTSSATTIVNITFDAGSPAYTMTGNTFRLNSVDNNSGALQTFSNTGGLLSNATTMTFNATSGNIEITSGYGLMNGSNKTLTVNGGTLTLGSLDLMATGAGGSARTTEINGSGNLIVSGVVQNTTAAGAINFTGNGMLTLAGANTHTGNTTLGTTGSTGTLVLSNSLALQDSTLARPGSPGGNNLTTLVFDSSVVSNAFTIGGLSGGSSTAGQISTITLTNNASNAVALTIGNNNANVTYSGVIAGTGSLLKIGSGTQTLSGANTFSGGLTIREGTVISSSFTQALGGNTGLVTLGDAATDSDVTLQPQMGGQTFANPIAVGDATNTNGYASTLQFGSGNGGIYSGAIQLNSHDLIINTGSTSAAVTYSGTSTGASGFTTGINGTGDLLLNTVGATTFAISNAAGNTVNTIGAVSHTGSGSGSVTIAASIGTNVTSLTQNSGTSNLILSGANTYTGETNVTSGTLILASGGSIVDSSQVRVNAGATFDTTAESFTMLGDQAFIFTLDPSGVGSAGLLNAAALNITSGAVDFNTLGSLDDAAYVIANYTSLTGLAFASVSSLPSGYTLDYNYNGLNQIALVVPEPSTCLLAGMGLLVVFSRSRRSRSMA